jgi:hypothetical protein
VYVAYDQLALFFQTPQSCPQIRRIQVHQHPQHGRDAAQSQHELRLLGGPYRDNAEHNHADHPPGMIAASPTRK